MAQPAPAAPTILFLEALKERLQHEYRPYHALCNEMERLYFREHQIYVPEVFRSVVTEVRTPLFEDGNRRAVAILTAAKGPTYTVRPVGQKERDRTRANQAEAWLNSFVPIAQEASGRSVFHNIIDNQVRFGVGYGLCVWRPDRWTDYESEPKDFLRIADEDTGRRRRETASERERRLTNRLQRQPFPFLLKDLDSRAVYVVRDDDGMRDVLYGVQMKRYDVALRFPHMGYSRRKKRLVPLELTEGEPVSSPRAHPLAWGDVEFWVHWDNQFVTYFADGVILEQHRHNYGRPPIFEARGISTSSTRPEYMFRPLFAHQKDLIPTLDAYLTMHHCASYLLALPAFYITQPPLKDEIYPDSQAPPKLEWRPGEITFLQPGQDIKPIQPPEAGEALRDQIQILLNIIKESTPVPPILKGFPPGSDTAGYAVNQMRLEARTVHEPILGGSADLWTGIAQLVLRTIDRDIRETVYLLVDDPEDKDHQAQTYLGLGPDVIRGNYNVQASIVADAPMQDIALARVGFELWKGGWIGHRYSLENFGKAADPDAIIDEVYAEQLENMPPILEGRLRRIAKKAGIDLPAPPGAPAPPPALGDLNAPAGPGLPPVAPTPESATMGPGVGQDMGAPSAQGPNLGGIVGVPQQPNTVALPGGMPV